MSAAVRAQLIVAMSVLVLCAAPAVIGWLIITYGVNVPYWDQMMIADFLIRNHGRAFPAIGDLLAQHNESRIVVPRILFFYLARVTGWNVKYEMGLSLVLAGTVAAAVCLLTRRAFDRTTAAAASAAAALLIFSPVQWWNWTVGFQLVLFVPAVMLACALLALSRGRVTLAAAAAAVATFSFANGIFLWLALLPAVWASGRDRKRRWLTVGGWTGAGIVTGALLYRGYKAPAGVPPMTLPYEAPGRFTAYCLAFLGHPLSWTRDLYPTIAVGGFLVVVFGGCLAVAWRQRRRAALEFAAFGLYAGLSAAAAAAGRLRLTLAQALEPRYTTLSIYLGVAVILLIFATASPRVQAVAVAVMVIAHLLAVRAEWPHMELFHRERLVGRAAVDFALVAADHSALHALVWPDVRAARRTIEGLTRIGYLAPIGTGLVSAIDGGGPPVYGDFIGLQPVPGGWRALGWAWLPGVRPADAVLLTRMSDAGEEIVGVSPLAALLQRRIGKLEPKLLHCGWQYSVPAAALTEGARLHAWAYDTELRLAYRLGGSFTVENSPVRVADDRR